MRALRIDIITLLFIDQNADRGPIQIVKLPRADAINAGDHAGGTKHEGDGQCDVKDAHDLRFSSKRFCGPRPVFFGPSGYCGKALPRAIGQNRHNESTDTELIGIKMAAINGLI